MIRRVRGNRRRSAPISAISLMRSASRTRFLPGMIGAGALPASSPPYGRSGCAGWSRSVGYNIQHIATSGLPAAAAQEHRMWYQWYFQTERSRADSEPPRSGTAIVAFMVAELAIRRGRPSRRLRRVSISRLCRGDDPVLPSPPPQRAGRPSTRANRTAPRGPAADHGADDRPARALLMACRRSNNQLSRRRFHRPLRPPRRSARRPFPVARNPRRSRASPPRPDRRPTLAAALYRHSITSLANPMTEGGIVIPSAFAVSRLITSSNLGSISTGKSAGFIPLRILVVYAAARRRRSPRLSP